MQVKVYQGRRLLQRNALPFLHRLGPLFWVWPPHPDSQKKAPGGLFTRKEYGDQRMIFDLVQNPWRAWRLGGSIYDIYRRSSAFIGGNESAI